MRRNFSEFIKEYCKDGNIITTAVIDIPFTQAKLAGVTELVVSESE